MKNFTSVSAFALLASLSATAAQADAPLSGSIKTRDGAPMAGVTVSAKMEGTPITTTDNSARHQSRPTSTEAVRRDCGDKA